MYAHTHCLGSLAGIIFASMIDDAWDPWNFMPFHLPRRPLGSAKIGNVQASVPLGFFDFTARGLIDQLMALQNIPKKCGPGFLFMFMLFLFKNGFSGQHYASPHVLFVFLQPSHPVRWKLGIASLFLLHIPSPCKSFPIVPPNLDSAFKVSCLLL